MTWLSWFLPATLGVIIAAVGVHLVASRPAQYVGTRLLAIAFILVGAGLAGTVIGRML